MAPRKRVPLNPQAVALRLGLGEPLPPTGPGLNSARDSGTQERKVLGQGRAPQGGLGVLANLDRVGTATPAVEEARSGALQFLESTVEAGERQLQGLEEQRQLLALQLAEIDALIAKVRAILGVEKGSIYDNPKQDALCPLDVDDMLFELKDQPITVKELVDLIHRRTGRPWAVSTVYGVLNKGKARGHYQNDAGAWWMTKEGRDAFVQ